MKQDYETLYTTRLVGKKAIRKAFREDYKRLGTYDLVADIWMCSNGVAWSIINKKYYWPKDEKISDHIWNIASKRGIPLGNRGGRDLWAMSPEELLWRLQNREEV